MTTPKKQKKVMNPISKTIKKANPLSPLNSKLKSCEMEVQHYVAALEAENLKLHKRIAKYQAESVSLNNQIKILKDDLKKCQMYNPMNISPDEIAALQEKANKIVNDKIKRVNNDNV